MTSSDINIIELNETYGSLSPLQRLEQVFSDFDHNEILVTSSFGTTSGILMGMVSEVAPGHPIHFIDTTFCFKQTLTYKRTLTKLLGLNIINVLPSIDDNMKSRETHLWETDPDQCCHINKVKPFEPYKSGKQIWVSGLLMNSNPFRENLEIFEARKGIIKMHPNIDTTAEGFEQFLIDHNIPPHPMKAKGYDSVGCTHCTIKGEGRSGRWAGKSKMECGLHTTT
ncbi:MAG: phosphoadenylyl-sulfate reductase [Bacteroidota bacterium]